MPSIGGLRILIGLLESIAISISGWVGSLLLVITILLIHWIIVVIWSLFSFLVAGLTLILCIFSSIWGSSPTCYTNKIVLSIVRIGSIRKFLIFTIQIISIVQLPSVVERIINLDRRSISLRPFIGYTLSYFISRRLKSSIDSSIVLVSISIVVSILLRVRLLHSVSIMISWCLAISRIVTTALFCKIRILPLIYSKEGMWRG